VKRESLVSSEYRVAEDLLALPGRREIPARRETKARRDGRVYLACRSRPRMCQITVCGFRPLQFLKLMYRSLVPPGRLLGINQRDERFVVRKFFASAGVVAVVGALDKQPATAIPAATEVTAGVPDSRNTG